MEKPYVISEELDMIDSGYIQNNNVGAFLFYVLCELGLIWIWDQDQKLGTRQKVWII